MSFPDEFDFEVYRTHPDLELLTDEYLVNHWREFGQSEGRRANLVSSRQNFINLIKTKAVHHQTLEISPFANPLLPKGIAKYCDVLSHEEPVQRGLELGYGADQIPTPDFVLNPRDGLRTIGSTFSTIVSSHMIEHAPDFVDHLKQIEERLDTGGHYFLLIPDKRFCFDHFLPESTLAEVVQAHDEKRERHSLQSVIEHRALTTHNDSMRHWQGDHHDPGYYEGQVQRTRLAIEEFLAAGGKYIDVHAWKFTPESFRNLTSQVCQLYDIKLKVVRVYATVRGSNEFWAVISRHSGESRDSVIQST